MLTLLAPAKLNLFLAVTGLRPDGFHNLRSLFVPLALCDRISISLDPLSRRDVLTLSGPIAVPEGANNIIVRAMTLFRKYHPFSEGLSVHLEKKIPTGAGLGGGSSNAVTLLKGLNQLLGSPLSSETLFSLALELGSDCPFFIEAQPSLVGGRGEQLEVLPASICELLEGQPIYLFKPPFSVSTQWAYEQLRLNRAYSDPVKASAQLEDCLACLKSAVPSFKNDFLPILSWKYPLFAVLLEQLHKSGFSAGLSGSGSTCFVWLNEKKAASTLPKILREALGANLFELETSIRIQ